MYGGSASINIGSIEWNRLISESAQHFGIHMDPELLNLFAAYAAELIAWNKKINLTAITKPPDIAVKHVVDSLVPSRYIPKNASLLDMGSGAGFPGIPLAILMPSVSVTLVDASRKKVSFLKHVSRILNLPNVEAHQCRAQDISQNRNMRRVYDIIISRALFPLTEFVSVSLPLISESGGILAMKGKKEKEEKEICEVTDLLEGYQKENGNKEVVCTIERYRLEPVGDERMLFRVYFK